MKLDLTCISSLKILGLLQMLGIDIWTEVKMNSHFCWNDTANGAPKWSNFVSSEFQHRTKSICFNNLL